MNAPLSIIRTNTILYCALWTETVSFYTDSLGLATTYTTDWFIEVHLCGDAHLSIADASRATIAPGEGAGLTLSWQVSNLSNSRTALVDLGMTVSDIATRWDSYYVQLHDPEGTRIELWSPSP